MIDLLDSFNRLGYVQKKIDLPFEIDSAIEAEDWDELDRQLAVLTSSSGTIFTYLNSIRSINQIEFIIAIRECPDDDGIWHDDGSRKIAYTLSLTKDLSQLDGGVLQFRKKMSSDTQFIPTPKYGTLTIFKTGVDDYEHCVLKVNKGRRIISAGWGTMS